MWQLTSPFTTVPHTLPAPHVSLVSFPVIGAWVDIAVRMIRVKTAAMKYSSPASSPSDRAFAPDLASVRVSTRQRVAQLKVCVYCLVQIIKVTYNFAYQFVFSFGLLRFGSSDLSSRVQHSTSRFHSFCLSVQH